MLKFSVVTITYNSERYLEEAINSVVSQGYQDLEYIIVDGGSTDGSLSVIRKFAATDSRIRWISEPDMGISDAMNKGIKLSTGDVIAHLHSDDAYLPGTLRRVAEIFQANPPVKWVTGLLRVIDGSGAAIYDTTLKASYSFMSLIARNLVGHPATFIRKEIFDEVGGFDTNLRYAMDYDLWLRIASRYEPLAINQVFAKFRSHQDSLSSRELLNAIDEEFSIKKAYRKKAGFLTLLRAYLILQKNKLAIHLGLHNILKTFKQRFHL